MTDEINTTFEDREDRIRRDQTRLIAEQIDEAMGRMRNTEHRQIVEAVRELIGRLPGGER